MIHHDDGAWVTPGLRGTQITSQQESPISFDQSTSPGLVDGAVHTVVSDQSRDRLLVGSKYGITALDPFGGTASLHPLPSGIEMNTMFRWTSGDLDYLIIGSNIGLHHVILENGLPDMGTLTESNLGPIEHISELDTGAEILTSWFSETPLHGQ